MASTEATDVLVKESPARKVAESSGKTAETQLVSNGFSLFADGLIATAAFFLVHYLKYGTFSLSPIRWKLLAIYLAGWLIAGWFAGKFEKKYYRTPKMAFKTIIRANFFWLYLVAFVVVFIGGTSFSRLFIFGSILFVGFVNTLQYLLRYSRHRGAVKERVVIRQTRAQEPRSEISYRRVLLDGILLVVSFFAVNYLKRDSLALHPGYGKALVFAFGLWLVCGLAAGKFERRHLPNIFHFYAPYLKAFLLLVLTSALVAFGLHLTGYSRLQIFGSYGFFLVLETLMVVPLWLRRYPLEKDIVSIKRVQESIQEEPEHPVAQRPMQTIYPVSPRLQKIYLKHRPELYAFIAENIDLQQVDMAESLVLYTHTPYNVEIVEDGSLSLFINLHRVNDFRFLNRYFLTVHRKFHNSGYFVGCAETVETHRKKMFNRYPQFIARALYPLDFLWRRVMPKLAGLRKLYFMLSRGRNRAISKAELLGRLYFCGFKVIAVKNIGFQLYYIAQKFKAPSSDTNPSYGPLIRLKRVGYGGELIKVYKLRTMHPYSEYLQEYVYEHNNLEENGKFKNDFRLTEWGKMFRMLWLDELPQLLNYFRDDLKLVGVRALSVHYFNLYPPDLRQMRIRQKPGLVPPYYADLPKNFSEILESERRYLQLHARYPFRTDCVYFFKAAYNILFRKARSR